MSNPYKEVGTIKEILKILENTVNQLTDLMKGIRAEDENPAYKIKIKGRNNGNSTDNNQKN
jgi:hypothetical protein